MTDDLTVSQGSSEGSPSTAPSSEDERIKGLQRAISAKEEALQQARAAAAAAQAQLEQYQFAQLSEPERVSVLNQRTQARLRELEAENERLRVAQKYPDVAQDYETLLRAPTAEAQVAYLKALKSGGTPPPALPDVSDVDRNNPMRTPADQIGQPPEFQMDEATADRLLAAWGNRPLRG